MLVLARPDIIEVILIVHFSPASRDENSTFARTSWLCMRMPHIVEIVHIDENMTLCCLILFLALTKQKSWNGKGFFRFVQHTVEPVAIRLCQPPSRPSLPIFQSFDKQVDGFKVPTKKQVPFKRFRSIWLRHGQWPWKKPCWYFWSPLPFEVIDPKAGFFCICSQKVGREEAIML